MPLKVLDRSGLGNSADIADAIRWAVDHGAKVLNLSLGGPGYSAVMERAVAYARQKGAVVVCAAGNTGTGQVSYPAAYAGAVAVGAVGPDGQLAPYSSWGEALDLVATGWQHPARPGQRHPPGDDRPRGLPQAGARRVPGHLDGHASRRGGGGAALRRRRPDPDEVERALFEGAQSEGAWTPRDRARATRRARGAGGPGEER